MWVFLLIFWRMSPCNSNIYCFLQKFFTTCTLSILDVIVTIWVCEFVRQFFILEYDFDAFTNDAVAYTTKFLACFYGYTKNESKYYQERFKIIINNSYVTNFVISRKIIVFLNLQNLRIFFPHVSPELLLEKIKICIGCPEPSKSFS